MKKFSFPLDRVLAWRRIQCEQERTVLERLIRERDALARKGEKIRTERNACEQDLAHSLHIDAFSVATLPGWQARVQATLSGLLNEQHKANARVTQQEAVLLEAERKVKLLERLRERRSDEWQAALAREEEQFAAEVFLAGYVRAKQAIDVTN